MWRGRLRQRQLLLMMVVWMGCTAAILLPWSGIGPHYYLLVFAAAASVFCGIVAGQLLELTRQGGRAAAGTLAVAVALLGIVAINTTTFARAQILTDDANAELLERLRQLPPASIVLLNFDAQYEYSLEMRLYLADYLGRPDLQLLPFDFSAPPPGDPGHPHYLLTPLVHNAVWPNVRGPLWEPSVGTWNASLDGMGRSLTLAFRIRRRWKIVDIGVYYAWCVVAGRVAPNMAGSGC